MTKERGLHALDDEAAMDPVVAERIAHPLFHGLDHEQLRCVAGFTEQRRCASGQRLFARGEAATTFFLVVEGVVALEAVRDGRRVRVETLRAGDMVGSSWLTQPHRWLVDARAVGPVAVLAIDGTCLRHRMELDPELGHALARRFVEALHRRLERLWGERAGEAQAGDHALPP